MAEQPSFTSLTDLAAERLGGKALLCSDDFFAEKENLLKPGRGIFIADKYTDRGKWMDGWESRRKRTPGHDWCIIQLATPGKIHGVDIDTNFFLGNHPPHASLEAANIPATDKMNFGSIQWKEILPKSPLDPGAQNFYEIADHSIYTHLRLNIYPDGGVARLKVYGEVFNDWSTINKDELIDLAAATNGAKSVLCNDMFFSHMDNLIMPGRGMNMGDGWETKRNRTPNNKDWVIVRLAHKGIIEKAMIDTRHFKGNYPDSCLIEGCTITEADESKLNTSDIKWTTILPQTKLSADHEHYYEKEITNKEPFTHVRLTIFPDGGISRMRLWGNIVRSMTLHQLNTLSKDRLAEELGKCCGSSSWVNKMLPFFPADDLVELLEDAEEQWFLCTEEDWKQAFAHHPKIGDTASLTKKFASTAEWASGEQSAVNNASAETIQALANGNKQYEEKFGYIFIVCATGKSAEEMLSLLQERLPNDPKEEIEIAADEQNKITKLRIEKLLDN